MSAATEETWIEKWIKWTIVVVLCMVVVLGIFNFQRIPTYRAWLNEKSPEVAMRYDQLSGQMDEAALRKHFEGVALQCYNEPDQPGRVAERICWTGIAKADGGTALTMAAFLDKGHLASVVVHVPWWVHGAWRDRLVAQYGKANRAGFVSALGGPVLRWTLPNGTLEYNRDRSLNPLEWSAVFWKAGPGDAKTVTP
jgi:hypothetical protein